MNHCMSHGLLYGSVQKEDYTVNISIRFGDAVSFNEAEPIRYVLPRSCW